MTSHTDHMVLRNDGLRCRRCGGHDRLLLPVETRVLVERSTRFVQVHGSCPATFTVAAAPAGGAA